MAPSVIPAVQELEKMFDYIWTGYMKGIYDAQVSRDRKVYGGFNKNQQPPVFPAVPVINIAPAGKRVLGVWYVPHVWENTTNAAVAHLAGKKPRSFGELNVSTNLLTENNETIMTNLSFGAMMHLNEMLCESSDSTVRRIWGQRKYVPKTNYISSRADMTFSKYGVLLEDTILPSYNTKWLFLKVTQNLEDHIKKYTMSNPKAFDTHRNNQKNANSTPVKGGQKKWQCPNCKIPLRAAKTIHLVCQCGTKVEYADKDKTSFMKSNYHLFTNLPGETTVIPTTISSNLQWRSNEKCALCEDHLNLYESWDGTIKYSAVHLDPAVINDYTEGPYTVERFQR